MAYDFNGSSDYIEATSAVVTGVPLTMACWFNSDSTTVNQVLMALTNATGAQRIFLEANGTLVGDPIRARVLNESATTSTGYSANTWHHAAGVFASTTSRRAYLDGVSSTEGTTTASPTGINTTSIGYLLFSSARSVFMDGRIAEAAIWNVALEASEIAALAKGFKPSLIRPSNLRFYAPLVREIADYSQARALTSSSPAVAVHPRRIS